MLRHTLIACIVERFDWKPPGFKLLKVFIAIFVSPASDDL
jgi:hypothetical protein